MYFIAGVATADLFAGNVLFSTSKTLLESSIAIGVTAEDVRAGTGAKLYGKYFHSSTFDLTLNEQMFKIEYIAKNVGGTVSIGGDALTNETVTLGVGGLATVVGTPVDFGGFGVIGWASKSGSGVWETVTFAGKTFTPAGGALNDVYCVKFATTDSAAKKLVVSASIIPSEITVYLTAKLFNGNPDSVGSATEVGTVTIRIPRFLLNGSQELSMNMTGVSSINLSGSALAYGGECGNDDYYAEIIETIYDANWYDEAIYLAIDDADFAMSHPSTKTLRVYAIYANATPKLVDNADLTFVSTTVGTATVAGTGIVTTVAGGVTTIRVKITAKPAVEGIAYLTVS